MYCKHAIVVTAQQKPKQAPIIPEVAPDTILIAALDLSGDPNVSLANRERIGS